MKNGLLNEELVKQIRLMNFDRSKTLFEQKPDNLMPGQSDNPLNPDNILNYKKTTDCKNKEDFIDSYPNCCKYKEISVSPPDGKEFINFNEETGLGYCFIDTKIPGVGLNISNEDTLTFATQTTQQEMVEKLVSYYVADDFKMYTQHLSLFTNSNTFKEIDKSSKGEYWEARIESLTEYFSRIIGTYFPVGSVVRVESKEGNAYSVSLFFDDTSNEFRFDYWYDQDGQPYKQAGWQDNRNQYQKFIDDYGVVVQLGVLIGASLLTIATEGATAALVFEVAAELGIGAAIAHRDFEKGDNIMGWVNLLGGGISALKFMKYFRGISKADLDATVKALKNSGLPPNASKEQVMSYLKNIKDPKITNVINIASTMDDYTMNALKTDLAQDMSATNVLKEMKEIIKADPKILGNVKFFERLWVLDLKRQLGFMFAGIALNMTPLADLLNDVEKQKHQWILQNLPENKAKIFDQSAAINPRMQKEILDSKFNEIIEKSKKLTNKQKAQMVFEYQQMEMELKNPDPKIFKNPEYYQKLGYKNLTDEEALDLNGDIEIFTDSNGSWWVDSKNLKKN
jgi:hypothetical protein